MSYVIKARDCALHYYPSFTAEKRAYGWRKNDSFYGSEGILVEFSMRCEAQNWLEQRPHFLHDDAIVCEKMHEVYIRQQKCRVFSPRIPPEPSQRGGVFAALRVTTYKLACRSDAR